MENRKIEDYSKKELIIIVKRLNDTRNDISERINQIGNIPINSSRDSIEGLKSIKYLREVENHFDFLFTGKGINVLKLN